MHGCVQGHPYVFKNNLHTFITYVSKHVQKRPCHTGYEPESTRSTTCKPRVLMSWVSLVVSREGAVRRRSHCCLEADKHCVQYL